MKLNIIVPHYMEPWSTCKYLFDSIALQRGIQFDDIRVIVVNDGDNILFGSVERAMFQFRTYPFTVDYIVKEHEGVSAARNCGLDESDADYVMFCDIDDGFLSNCGLHLVFNAMKEGFDWINSDFIEETRDVGGNWAILRHDNDMTFMHGKVYKRAFLVEKKIRFVTGMNLHEDGFFNTVAYIEAFRSGTQKRITTPFYLWRWNDHSTVRSNREAFVLRTYDDVILTRAAACHELKERGYQEDFEANVAITVLNSYYDFQKTEWLAAKNKKYLTAALKAFKGFWNSYGKTFNNMTNIRIAEIAKAARQTATENGMMLEQETLKAFIRRIENDVK